MARLEDIREGLYRRDGRGPEPDRSTPAVPRRPDGLRRAWEEGDEPAPTLLERAYLSSFQAKRMAGRTLLTLTVVLVVGVSAFVGYTLLFGSTDVQLEILGPGQLTAGEPTLITVRVVNRGRVNLKESSVTLTLPAGAAVGEKRGGFSPLRERVDIGDVPAGGSFQREVRVQFLGARGETARVSGLLLYRPESIESKLTRQGEYAAAIVRVPVALTIDAPARVSSGQEVAVVISVDAETSVRLPDLTLGVELPSGFKLTAADPAPQLSAGVNLWMITSLEAGTSTRVTLRGTVAGDPEEVKAFRARLGRYDRSSERWLVVTEATGGPSLASPLLLAQASLGGSRRGVVGPGQILEGAVRFRNNLPERIENITVTLAFPERFVELESVQAENGFYDASRRAITWNPASAPNLSGLESGEEGTLSFTFKLKPAFPLRSFAEKNLAFTLVTTIDTAAIPPAYRGVDLSYQETLEFKIASHLALTARASYYDSPAANSGPLPPRVRSATTYAITLRLTSGANDVSNIEVRSKLAGGAEFRRAVSSDIGTVEFNEASRDLIWRLRGLPAATGSLRPPVGAVIQIAFIPAENQVGSSPPLVQDIAAAGTDDFTGAELRSEADNLTTELNADPRSNSGEWRVAP